MAHLAVLRDGRDASVPSLEFALSTKCPSSDVCPPKHAVDNRVHPTPNHAVHTKTSAWNRVDPVCSAALRMEDQLRRILCPHAHMTAENASRHPTHPSPPRYRASFRAATPRPLLPLSLPTSLAAACLSPHPAPPRPREKTTREPTVSQGVRA